MTVPQRVDTVPSLPPRPRGAHKGYFGRVLVVAGSRGFSGAAVLCASGALRGGAGLVQLAVPESLLPIAAAANPCYMTAGLPEDEHGLLAAEAGPRILELIEVSDVAVLGPGLGQSEGIRAVVSDAVARAAVPLVLDADALNVLVDNIAVLRQRRVPSVLTPHPGEFGRLVGCDSAAVQSHRVELALRFAAEERVVLVLKGHGTIVTDGQREYVNTTGNPGMATGGSGDVLAGLIAALIGQGLEAFAAAQLGVFLHGRAGDLAAAELGEVGLIASDLVAYLPRAFRSLGS